jgi:hypothetical protein
MAGHLRSNAVAYLALFFAISVPVYAATKAPKNSVVSKSIKDGQVQAVDLSDGAVTSPKLADGVITAAKLAEGAVAKELTPGSVSGTEVEEASLDPTVLQRRVNASCAAGAALSSVGQGGDGTCNSFPTSLPPSGTAGGDLSGSYPNPQLATDSVGEAELDVGLDFIQVPGLSDTPFCVGNSANPYWRNLGDHVNNAAAYGRDPSGVVHIRGLIQQCFGNPLAPEVSPVIFTLPPGFRPAREEVVLGVSSITAGFVRINVGPNGEVSTSNPPGDEKWLSLDGISFRCDPSGADGCP